MRFFYENEVVSTDDKRQQWMRKGGNAIPDIDGSLALVIGGSRFASADYPLGTKIIVTVEIAEPQIGSESEEF